MKRQRIYLAGADSAKVYAIDLPSNDCGPPEVGLAHQWTLDGNLNDPIEDRALTMPVSPDFAGGIVGQGVDLSRAAMELTTPNMTADGITTNDGTLSLWMQSNGPAQ